VYDVAVMGVERPAETLQNRFLNLSHLTHPQRWHALVCSSGISDWERRHPDDSRGVRRVAIYSGNVHSGTLFHANVLNRTILLTAFSLIEQLSRDCAR
jgi:hypothetical protein